MSRLTYYIVQLAPDKYVGYNGPTRHVNEAKFTTELAEAMGMFRTSCRCSDADTPRRFPRIVKVTIETKTVKDRR